MDEIKPRCPDQNLVLNRLASQEFEITLRAGRPRVAHGLGCEVFVGGGTLRINIEAHRLIMVSADHGRSMMPDPLNHLMRSRPVIDEIAQAPEVIKALLRKGFDGSEIAVNI